MSSFPISTPPRRLPSQTPTIVAFNLAKLLSRAFKIRNANIIMAVITVIKLPHEVPVSNWDPVVGGSAGEELPCWTNLVTAPFGLWHSLR